MESIIFKENNATFIIKVEFIQNKQMKILLEFQECRELRPFLTKHIPGICLRSKIKKSGFWSGSVVTILSKMITSKTIFSLTFLNSVRL